MEISKNQLVVFTDLNQSEFTIGFSEQRYSDKNQAFFTFSKVDESVKIFSNKIVDKPIREKKVKETDISKMVEIKPCGSTEKSYQLYDGSNGKVGRGFEQYYKYIAKSVCVIEDGKIYAPRWANR